METWAIKVTVATHAIVVLERLGDLWVSGDLGEIGEFVQLSLSNVWLG
jgi:hypothetical protein